MKKLVLAVLAVAVLGLAVLPACGNDIPSGAIVKVGDGVVSKADFDKYMNQAKSQATQQPGSPPFPSPGTAAYNQYAAQLVDYLVTQTLIRQEADKRKITVSDDEVQKALDDLYKAYGGQKKVEEIMKQQNMTDADLRALLKDQALGKKVYEAVTKDAQPDEAALKKYYDENIAQFRQPEQRATRHILVKDKATADKVYAALKADGSDADWKKLAKQYSIDPSGKNKGGDLGVVSPGQMPLPFEKALFAAQKGVVTGPVKSSLGWHVFEVTNVTPAQEQSFDKAKGQISQMLSSQLVEKAWQDWLKKAKSASDILYAAGYDPAKLTAQPSLPPDHPSVTPQPTATKTKK